MGTNYYWTENVCECCGRKDLIHIGKSSYGWAFSFRGHSTTDKWKYLPTEAGNEICLEYEVELYSWKQYKEFLKNKIIYNEYNEIVDYNWFVDFVENEKSPNFVNETTGLKNLNHIYEILSNPRCNTIHSEYSDRNLHWNDEDGYSFSSTEFS